jgi:cob(I)alamin adenosyltransferase
MKIYTGTGDAGKTSLFSGERMAKSDPRIDAYGDVDELNSIIGAVASALPPHDAAEPLKRQLTQIQSDLLHAGAWLATSADSPHAAQLTPIPAERIQELEGRIDAMQAELPELKSFILPGGHVAAAWAHVARTVCRRAERKAVALNRQQTLAAGAGPVLVFLNRLSDYFFVLARRINQMDGVPEQTWPG